MMEPYNDSIFKLRYKYGQIFEKIWRNDLELEGLQIDGKVNNQELKVFKIRYYINILSFATEDEDKAMINAIAESEEMDIFETPLIKDYIDFKWERFAFRQHLIGFCFHITYVVTLMYYIAQVYLKLEGIVKVTDVIPDTGIALV
jgi:hypothetical protein